MSKGKIWGENANMTTELMNNLGLVIGLILAIIGIILQIRSTKNKQAVYSVRSNNLISGTVSTLENLNITYKEQKIVNLTASKILFFNRGAETIHRQDIETINPLRISSKDCTILDCSILWENNPSNNFKVHFDRANNNHAHLDFDYLDKDNGVIIQVIHTGLKSDNIDLRGDIKGVKKLKRIPSYMIAKIPPVAGAVFAFLMMYAVITLAVTTPKVDWVSYSILGIVTLFAIYNAVIFSKTVIVPSGLYGFHQKHDEE